jgi:hypothetical protein
MMVECFECKREKDLFGKQIKLVKVKFAFGEVVLCEF